MNRNDIAELMDALEMLIWLSEILEQRSPSPEARQLINHTKNTLIRAKKKYEDAEFQINFASTKHSR